MTLLVYIHVFVCLFVCLCVCVCVCVRERERDKCIKIVYTCIHRDGINTRTHFPMSVDDIVLIPTHPKQGLIYTYVLEGAK